MGRYCWTQKRIGDTHIDSFWYDETICSYTKKGITYRLIAAGDIRISVLGESYRDYHACEYASINNWNDNDLYTDLVDWINNNWFEVVADYKGEGKYMLGDVAGTFDEGIEMFKNYIKEDTYRFMEEDYVRNTTKEIKNKWSLRYRVYRKIKISLHSTYAYIKTRWISSNIFRKLK